MRPISAILWPAVALMRLRRDALRAKEVISDQ